MYKLTQGGVKDLIGNKYIPNDLANRDWQKYQKWLAEGNTPEPEFTTEELTEKKGGEIKALEIAIVDMRVRKEGANAEGLIELEADADAELVELRAELAAEKQE